MLLEGSIRIAALVFESIVDGPGVRSALFTQGCPHACPGCHNAHTWNIHGGTEYAVQALYEEIRACSPVKALTITGGEPLCQAKALASLVRPLSEEAYNIWLYTGFVFEDLLDLINGRAGDALVARADCMHGCMPANLRELLEFVDVLIDGPFVQDFADYRLLYKGSSNQRILDCKQSLKEERPILFEEKGSDRDILEVFTKVPSW